MLGNLLEETEKLLSQIEGNALAKVGGIQTGTGLVWYDLEQKAKLLYPVRTPLRNEIVRVGNRLLGQGLMANWKVITAINTPLQLPMVQEGQRGAAIGISEANKSAAYKTFSFENPVTFQADWAARGFDDVKEIAMLTALQSLMIAEEQTLLHGNTSLALGQTATVTAATATTGGSLPLNTSYYCFCVALSYIGTQLCIPSNTSPTTTAGVAGGVVPLVTRTNADNTTTTMNGGVAKVSTASGTVETGSSTSTNTVTFTVAATQGAYAYAWFVSTTNAAASCLLTAVTFNNSVTIGSLSAQGTQKADGSNTSGWVTTTDYSTNALTFDGLITQALTGSGYYSSLGSTLTADSAGGVVEFDTALQYFWDTYQASPTQIICNSQQIKDLKKKIIGNGGSGTPVFRINLDNVKGDIGSVVGSARVGSYLNQFALGDAQELPVRIHPYMPPGKVFFDLEVSPYPNSNIGEARAVRTRQDYFAVEWPLTTAQYQYAVMVDEMLQVYVPFLSGIIDNISAG